MHLQSLNVDVLRAPRKVSLTAVGFGFAHGATSVTRFVWRVVEIESFLLCIVGCSSSDRSETVRPAIDHTSYIDPCAAK